MPREKKLTEKQLYVEKMKYLDSILQEVSPKEFYRDIFPVGSFEKKLEKGQTYEDIERRANGILVRLIHKEDKVLAKQTILTDELDWVDDFSLKKDVILSPISYRGSRRKTCNAHFIYAIAFDLDYQNMNELKDTIHQMTTTIPKHKHSILPKATYLVLSGHGLHVYYVLEKPLPMFPYIVRELNKLKKGLTRQIWNRYTSYEKNVQYQPVAQGFRMVGSASKMGTRYPVRAYKLGDKWNPQNLVEWITEPEYMADLEFRDTIPLDQAEKMFPEWYKRRVLKKASRGQWSIKRDLYEWWKTKISREIKVGHRYFGIMALAIYGVKCGIPFKEVKRDAYSFIDDLDYISESDSNRFTVDDVDAALKAYHEGSQNYPRDTIAKITGVSMPENKRNYRTQAEHIRVMNAIRDVVNPDWRNKDGRPKGSINKMHPKKYKIKAWRKKHPAGKKIECHKETGISRPTIDKYWDECIS